MPSDAPEADESSLFAPGESPFRGKGLIYLASRQYAERHLPRGWDAVLDQLRPAPALAAFLDTASFERLDERHFRVVRGGVPRPLAAWYAAMTEPYCLRLLRLAGAREAVFRPEPAAPVEHVEHGVPLVTIAFEARWR